MTSVPERLEAVPRPAEDWLRILRADAAQKLEETQKFLYTVYGSDQLLADPNLNELRARHDLPTSREQVIERIAQQNLEAISKAGLITPDKSS